MAPFNTVGMALHMAATNVMRMASEAVKPVVMIEEAALQPAAVTRSENQYMANVHPVQVCSSGGTGS